MHSRITCDGYYEQVNLTEDLLNTIGPAIEKATIKRPEFVVEILSTVGNSLVSLHLARAWSVQSESDDGWCLTYSPSDNPSNSECLSHDSTADSTYGRFVYCGAESEVLESCVLDWPTVAAAVLSLTKDIGSMSGFQWIPSKRVLNLDAVAAQFGLRIRKD